VLTPPVHDPSEGFPARGRISVVKVELGGDDDLVAANRGPAVAIFEVGESTGLFAGSLKKIDDPT
jgi:hypothetical protein